MGYSYSVEFSNQKLQLPLGFILKIFHVESLLKNTDIRNILMKVKSNFHYLIKMIREKH